MDRISRILKFSLVLLMIASLTSCGSKEETTAPGPTVQGISLSITNTTCPSVGINLNDEVKWTNGDTVERPLRVEYPDGLTMSDLGVVQPGDSVSLNFPEAGTFTYFCAEDQAITGTITVKPSQIPEVIPTETLNSTEKVKVYRDANAGFALDYPAEWFVEDDAAENAAGSAVYTISLFSWDRASYTPAPKDLNTLPDGATKIDITVFNQGSSTLEEAINQYKNQDSGTPVIFQKEEDWTLNNGEKATYLESEGAFGVVATMITLVKGRTIYVSGYGNLIPFKAIALSLRAD